MLLFFYFSSSRFILVINKLAQMTLNYAKIQNYKKFWILLVINIFLFSFFEVISEHNSLFMN